MPKVQYPPQAGEKRLCISLFLTMMMSVVSAVIIIYCIVIIYIPAKIVLESNLTGPKMCTTLSKEGNMSGDMQCGLPDPEIELKRLDDPTIEPQIIEGSVWHSCEEWCLSKSNKACSHVWASARDQGTEIYWDNCDNITLIDHECNIIDTEEKLNCKLYPSEQGSNAAGDIFAFTTGDKDRCSVFDNIQISCMAGICRNYSSVYSCNFQSYLDEIETGWKGRGYCDCQKCNAYPEEQTKKYPNECPALNQQCIQWYPNYPNDTMRRHCSEFVPCSDCKSICSARQQCFDMKKRKDPTMIGTDLFGMPELRYYTCNDGYCSEIYDLKCKRRCDEKVFDTRGKNTFIFNGERIIIARCNGRSVATGQALEFEPRLMGKNKEEDVLMVSCSVIKRDADGHTLQTEDCVNGTWFPNDFNGGRTNYSHLLAELGKRREIEKYREESIHYEQDITIFNKTKLKVNIQGCKNDLNMSCMSFYANYGRDGRNHTARAVYECFFDPDDGDFVVVEFDPEKTLRLLILFSLIPGAIMIVGCFYCCGCSKFVETQEDGHMRVICCGKAVTGIGNVPKWDPPRRKRFQKLDNKEKDLKVVVDTGDGEKEQNEENEMASINDMEASAPPKSFDMETE